MNCTTRTAGKFSRSSTGNKAASELNNKEALVGRVKSLEEIKAMIRDRTGKRNIFRRAKREDVESVSANLTSKDPELWAAEWSRVARNYEEEATRHEQAGRLKDARDAYVQAYTYYATGRYPVPHTVWQTGVFPQELGDVREGR